MRLQDDRTPKQVKSHPVIVMGTDDFMSGWGAAEGGPSYAGWACRREDANTVERWVRARGDMKRIRLVSGNGYKAPSGPGHVHIYVVDGDHAALGEK